MLLEATAPRRVGRRARSVTWSTAAKGRLVAVTRAGEPRLDVENLLGQEGDVLHIAVMTRTMADARDGSARTESGTARQSAGDPQ